MLEPQAVFMVAGKLLLLALVVGLIAFFCISRRARPLGLIILGLLLPAWYYLRISSSADATATVKSPVPAAFEPSTEQLRHAKVFPSIGQAAANLTARIADSLSTLPEGRREPARIALTVPTEIRPSLVAALRTAFPRAQQSVATGPTTRPAGTDEVQLRIELTSEPPVSSRSPSVPRQGTLRAAATGIGGTVEESVQFVDKPWAGDGVTTAWSIVGRSQAPCTSAAEALTQARDMAAAELRPLIVQRLAESGRSDLESDEPWFANRIRAAVQGPRFIQDEFVQELAMPYGSVYRASVLISTSPGNISLGSLCESLIAQRRQHTVHTLSTAGAIGALSLLIFLVYLFLNTVTRGYFTLRLRLAAVGLLAAAVLLVIMVSG